MFCNLNDIYSTILLPSMYAMYTNYYTTPSQKSDLKVFVEQNFFTKKYPSYYDQDHLGLKGRRTEVIQVISLERPIFCTLAKKPNFFLENCSSAK